MEYFNAGGGATSGNGATDPYAVIPQQFGNGGQPPPQQAVFEYPQDSGPDYETYQQQQQQYRANQASQQSQSVYFQNQMTAAQASYFPIHSASDHDYLTDFLGPQAPATGVAAGSGGGGGAPYQSRGGANKEFMIQHQQRRGNQSGQQQGQQQSQQNNQQNQSGRSQNQQQLQQQTNQPTHFMQHPLHAVAQQQAQQMHRLHGAPITPQQFMVPPPSMMQPPQMQQAQQQQQVQQIHQMQLQQQQQHSQMMQQQAQQGYHPHQQTQHQQGHHQNQNNNQNHNHHAQNHPGPHHIPPNPMSGRPIFKLKDWPIRCVVEGKYHSVICGPQGSTIRDISHATHCRVDFANLSKRERTVLGNNDRILIVHGNAEHASNAVSRILHVIQSEALKDDDNVGVDIVLRLRAHNQLCGRLIGKAGSSIKEIMQKTGTSITVAKYSDPQGGLGGLRQEEALCLMERTIMVRGPSIEAVVQAESLISAKLKKCYETDSQIRAQAMNSPMPPMMFPPLPPGSAISLAQVINTPNGLFQVQNFPPSQHQLHPSANNSFLQSGTLHLHPGMMTLRQLRMWVPDNMIGALIGAKGKNIKMLIRDTGATVKIEAPEEKVQREAEEAAKKQKRAEEGDEDEKDGAASGDHPQEFLEDNGTVTSADAIEEKPKPVSERMVTISGDDLQLLRAQSHIFTKIVETSSSSSPSSNTEIARAHELKIRTEISVPTKIIGRIIGKGGQNVRELQRISGAVVKIPEEERNGGDVHRHDDGYEEEMTLIRVLGNMFSTHNVHFRLAHLVGEYYHSGEHRQNKPNYRGRPQSAPSSAARKDGSSLNKMDQLGQVPPIANTSNRTTPKSASPPKSKSP